MSKRRRILLAVMAVVLCLGASQYAMRGRHAATGNVGYLGTELAGVEASVSSSLRSGVIANNTGTGSVAALASGGYGVSATGASDGVGVSGSGRIGVSGTSSSTSPAAYGVEGYAVTIGVSGQVYGSSPTSAGVLGLSYPGYGVKGVTLTGTGVYGVLEPEGSGHAGYFSGPVTVDGSFTHNASSLRIDHPTDPAGKYLTHAGVESSERMNIYNGIVELDVDGAALVSLPEWFEALNKDFRYQLTCIGGHAPVYIAEEVKENRFRIAGGYAGMRVSWQVTGVRRDPFAEAHPLVVAQVKPPHEIGRYLHPELYRQDARLRVMPNAPNAGTR